MKSKLLVYIITICLFTACKEDEKVDPASYFTVNGQTIALQQGFLFDYGSNSDFISRDFDIVLSTEGLSYDENKKGLVGEASFIFFDLNVNSTEKFEPGTFTWSEFIAPNTMVDGFAGITCSFDNQTCSYQSLADGGTVTVELNGEVYTLNFEITLEDGQSASGYFRGPLFIR